MGAPRSASLQASLTFARKTGVCANINTISAFTQQADIGMHSCFFEFRAYLAWLTISSLYCTGIMQAAAAAAMAAGVRLAWCMDDSKQR